MVAAARRAIPGAAVLAAAVSLGLGLVPRPGLQSAGDIERLGAEVIRVPNATATPATVVLTSEVWLRATNLPEDEPVTVTLNAPDGTDCVLPSWLVHHQGREADAFAAPADCAEVEGAWTATFDAQRLSVKARFTAVAVPWFARRRAGGSPALPGTAAVVRCRDAGFGLVVFFGERAVFIGRPTAEWDGRPRSRSQERTIEDGTEAYHRSQARRSQSSGPGEG